MYAEPQVVALASQDAEGTRAAAGPDGSTSGLEFCPQPQTLAAQHVVGFERMNDRVHPFLVMRSRLLKHVRATNHRTIAITSVQPGDGKTHVATNLAAALSRVQPTVLVELDLRSPSIGQRLGLPKIERGIDDYLAGHAEWRDVGIRIKGSRLTVYPTRVRRYDAEALLASPRLVDFLLDLRLADPASICLVDTPPARVNDDLMLIARSVDGIVMVVREARTRGPALLDTISALSPTPFIGPILNMSISSTRPDNDYGKYYDMPDPGEAG